MPNPNPKTAALIGIMLCLPGAIVFSLVLFNIEPNFGPLQSLLAPPDDGPHVAGSLMALVFLVILPLIALRMNVVPVRRTLRAGGTLLAHPANLLLTCAILGIVALLVGTFVADQFPCWMGVANCD